MKRKSNSYSWLYPGLKLKRWAIVGGIAMALFIIGIWSMVNNHYSREIIYEFVNFMQRTMPDLSFDQGLLCAVLGFVIIVVCIQKFNKQYHAITSHNNQNDDLYKQAMLSSGPKIVVIGGGTGLSVLLKGIKKYSSNVTAVVSVGDDGGSSGRLRRDFGVIPVGDIRSCIVALADEEDIMEKVFNFRFSRGEGLKGHSLGNLLLLALTSISGNFQNAVASADQILHMGGRVFPITMEPLVLHAEMVDGSKVVGECNIGESEVQIESISIEPPYAQVLPAVLDAIDEADAIILGPGSLYTSIIPNLCVHQVVDAINASQAKTFYICNITTQPGETTNYSAADHLEAIYRHSCPEMIDYMLVDDGSIKTEIEIADFLVQASGRVKVDYERLEKCNTKVIETSLVNRRNPYHHDSDKLGKAIMETLYKDRDFRFRRGFFQTMMDYQRIRREERAKRELFK